MILRALLLLLCTLPAQAASVQLFFSPPAAPQGPEDCARVAPLRRELPPGTTAVATASLRLLFAGPSEAERAAGWRSPFSAATAGWLQRLVIRQGTAYVDLSDLRQELSGATSGCGAAELRAQMDRTLLQFKSVRRVRYAIDGDPRAFHEWLGEDCGAANGHCDPRPFAPLRQAPRKGP